MTDIYEARWENAKRIARIVQSYIDNGHVVLDHDGDLVNSMEIGANSVYTEHDNMRVVYYVHDKDWDDGYYTPIDEYNQQFAEWQFLKKVKVKL